MKNLKYCGVVLTIAFYTGIVQAIIITNVSNERAALYSYPKDGSRRTEIELMPGKSQTVLSGRHLSWVQVNSPFKRPHWSSKAVMNKSIKSIDFGPGIIRITYTDNTVNDSAPATNED